MNIWLVSSQDLPATRIIERAPQTPVNERARLITMRGPALSSSECLFRCLHTLIANRQAENMDQARGDRMLSMRSRGMGGNNSATMIECLPWTSHGRLSVFRCDEGMGLRKLISARPFGIIRGFVR